VHVVAAQRADCHGDAAAQFQAHHQVEHGNTRCHLEQSELSAQNYTAQCSHYHSLKRLVKTEPEKPLKQTQSRCVGKSDVDRQAHSDGVSFEQMKSGLKSQDADLERYQRDIG
jgi:hypothetical protein